MNPKAAQGFISEMAADAFSALDALLTARKILGCIADVSPPEDRLPPP